MTGCPRFSWIAVLAVGLGLGASAEPALACTIYVSHSDDADPPFWTLGGGSDDKMLFREAVEIAAGNYLTGNPVGRCFSDAEKNHIVGGNFIHNAVACGTLDNTRNWQLSLVSPGCGPNDADTIAFVDNIAGGTTIFLNGFLRVDPLDTIDGGASAPGIRGNIDLFGPTPAPPAALGGILFNDLSAFAASGAVRNLTVENFTSFGVAAAQTNGLTIENVIFANISGDALALNPGPASATEYCLFNAQVGGPASGQQNVFYNITGAAISMSELCPSNSSARNNKIFNNFIGVCEALDTGLSADACTPGGAQGVGYGIYVHDLSGTAIGGSGSFERNVITRASGAGVLLDTAATGNSVRGNLIGLTPTGAGFSRPNATGVKLAGGASNNTIGGTNAGEGNTISANALRGVTLDGAGTSGNRVSGNVIGLNATRTALRPNADGIGITNGADTTQIDNNVIAGNSLWGIYLNGGGGQQVHDNIIGLRGTGNNANDDTATPNGNGGVWINNVGGSTVGPGNRIAGNNGPGVQISGEGADGNVVKGNTIGLDNAGAASANTGGGVYVGGGPDNTVIGGSTAADRNIVGGNTGSGIRVSGNTTDTTTIRFNFVGTDASGNVARANSGEGIHVDQGATNTQIEQNLVAANGNDGIKLETGATGSYVILNQIGVSNSGTVALPNSASGISMLSGAFNNAIGDPVTPFVFNVVVSHNGAGSAGIFVADPGTANNAIAGNIIGSAGFANNYGIYVTNGAIGTQILGNVISDNSKSGVAIVGGATTGNAINDNQIFDNGGLGIDLGADGATANDFEDGDTGPNNLQNFPTLTDVALATNSVTLTARLNSQTNKAYTVTLYRSDRCDPSGYGEGKVELGTTIINSDGNGNGNVAGLMYSVPNSQTQASWGTAIARSPTGDTSEFGPCVGISDHIFGNGFSTAGAAPLAAVPADEAAASSMELAAGASDVGIDGTLDAVGDRNWQLSLRIDNRSTHPVSAQVVGVSASAAIVVRDMQTSVGTCVLSGRVECHLPALASGEVAAITLRLGALQDEPFAFSVQSELDGRPRLQREFKTTPDNIAR